MDTSLSGESVVIIGAGPAGLIAAYELFKNGVPAVVLEADHMVGGLARTVNYNSYRFDIGGHRFFTSLGRDSASALCRAGDRRTRVPKVDISPELSMPSGLQACVQRKPEA